jgi:hypothetical protein
MHKIELESGGGLAGDGGVYFTRRRPACVGLFLSSKLSEDTSIRTNMKKDKASLSPLLHTSSAQLKNKQTCSSSVIKNTGQFLFYSSYNQI